MSVRTHRCLDDVPEACPLTPERLEKARKRYWSNLEHCRAIARRSYRKHIVKNRAATKKRMAKLAAKSKAT